MATNTSNKRKQQRRMAAIRLVILAAILICVNMLAARFNYGLDLTQEKRFTLSHATRNLLSNMDDVAIVDIYLKGEFPAGFQRLAEATRGELQHFKSYAGNHLIFRFVDPVEGKNEKEKREIYMQLAEKNIMPVNLQVESGDAGYSEKIILPYAMVRYKGREVAVKLLDNHAGMGPMDVLNYSESMLEYKFADALHQLTLADKPRIAYVTGNNESIGLNTYDALTTLAQNYHLDTFDLARNFHIPLSYDAIIINKPTIPFEEKEKFILDQYVMGGGHVLWIINELQTDMDSLVHNEQFITADYGLNLDDMLFKYGVRINPDLIEDMQCAYVPIVVGMNGNRPDTKLKPWIYFPIVNPVSRHPIVKNMPPVLSKFANSIDTIENPEIKKTVLLQSSKYSRTSGNPVRVSLGIVKYPMTPEMFKNPFRPMAVLLEGKFQSVFQNHLSPGFLHIWKDSLKEVYRTVCDSSNSMIVMSADIMNNDFSNTKGPLEMGYWQFTESMFANKTLLLNSLEYLTDRSGLIEARSKDVTLRLLDGGRVKKEKETWQILNIGIPIAIVLIFASCYLFFRKRRYETKK